MRAVVTHEGGSFKRGIVDSGDRKVQLDRAIVLGAGESVDVLTATGQPRSMVVRNFLPASVTDPNARPSSVRIQLSPSSPFADHMLMDEDSHILMGGPAFILMAAEEGTGLTVRSGRGAAIPLWPEVDVVTLSNIGLTEAEIRLVVF